MRLPDDPASAEFWAAIKILQSPPKAPGTLLAMIDAYQESPAYKALAEATRREYGRYMASLRAALPNTDATELQPKHIAEFRDNLGATPAKANAYIRAIAALYKFGRQRGFATINPAEGIDKLKIGEHQPWPQWAWETAVTHFRPEIRIACQLGHYTGQRLGDVLRMKLTDIGAEGLNLTQQKTKKSLTIPIHGLLAPVISDCRKRGRIYLVSRDDGTPFTVDQFHAMWGREMRRSAELLKIKDAGLSFHGLRKKLATDAANAGATGKEIGALTGQTLPVVEHYTKAADQKRLAQQAMKKLEGRSK